MVIWLFVPFFNLVPFLGKSEQGVFQNDGVHLNNDGTYKIIELIFNRVRSTPRRFLQ